MNSKTIKKSTFFINSSLIPLIFLCFFLQSMRLSAQSEKFQFRGFGHQEYTLQKKDSLDSYFSIGEHDFFITANLSSRISFLGEYVVRFNSGSGTAFLPSIERSFIKFNYINNHSVIAGKVHTPVNYWNDVYHHGRLLFPVIDRPFSFSYLVPLHTLGIQFQGQNLGKSGFGYDLVLGNGVASTDNFQGGVNPSVTAALHIKPVSGMRIGLSYYANRLGRNFSGPHIGHNLTPIGTQQKPYKGSLDIQLISSSFAWFDKKIELLNEFSFNQSRTDSLGRALSFANFSYFGYRLSDHQVPYVLLDYVHTSEKDLHVYPVEMLKAALGYRYEFNYLINLKAQLEHTWVQKSDGHLLTHTLGNIGFRLQLAYGF